MSIEVKTIHNDRKNSFNILNFVNKLSVPIFLKYVNSINLLHCNKLLIVLITVNINLINSNKLKHKLYGKINIKKISMLLEYFRKVKIQTLLKYNTLHF